MSNQAILLIEVQIVFSCFEEIYYLLILSTSKHISADGHGSYYWLWLFYK